MSVLVSRETLGFLGSSVPVVSHVGFRFESKIELDHSLLRLLSCRGTSTNGAVALMAFDFLFEVINASFFLKTCASHYIQDIHKLTLVFRHELYKVARLNALVDQFLRNLLGVSMFLEPCSHQSRCRHVLPEQLIAFVMNHFSFQVNRKCKVLGKVFSHRDLVGYILQPSVYAAEIGAGEYDWICAECVAFALHPVVDVFLVVVLDEQEDVDGPCVLHLDQKHHLSVHRHVYIVLDALRKRVLEGVHRDLVRGDVIEVVAV